METQTRKRIKGRLSLNVKAKAEGVEPSFSPLKPPSTPPKKVSRSRSKREVIANPLLEMKRVWRMPHCEGREKRMGMIASLLNEAQVKEWRRWRGSQESRVIQGLINSDVFNGEKPLPLAVGAAKIIRHAAREVGVSVIGSGKFLGRWTKRKDYIRAIAEGGPRYHPITGEITAVVSEEEQAHARRKLGVAQ